MRIGLSFNINNEQLGNIKVKELEEKMRAIVAGKDDSKAQEIYNNFLKILDSFKFIDETVNWNVYSNDKYKVSFKYPSNFKIVTDEVRFEYPNGKEWYRLEIADETKTERLLMSFEVDPDGYGPFFPDREYKIEETESGQIKIVDIITIEEVENLNDGHTWIKLDLIESRNGNAYFIQFIFKESGKDFIPIFDQILSTFKFLEPEIIDCGEVGPDNQDQAEEVQGCFEARFKECKPTKYIPSIDLGPLGGLVTYYYEIIGPDNGFCNVKSKFIKNPNLDWIGKEMICKYDNSKNFEEAIQDMSRCEGELYNLMHPN